MNADRWRLVEQVCQAALDLPPEARGAFLVTRCAGDDDLRREVESLLDGQPDAEGFLAAPAPEAVAETAAVEPYPRRDDRPLAPDQSDVVPPSGGATLSLARGTRLGPYEVLGLIGAGAMGEVYRARDTRLDRTVAVKILPTGLRADPERRVRFAREAMTIARLSHPHICTLFDVGEHDGATFLVMEDLAGETLAARLQKGPLPLEQALGVAAEMVDALAVAHRHGVIHRDLKPANVMLTKTGAKLLDFGLAKLTGHGEQPAGRAPGVGADAVGALTGEGRILGTLQYMAPEQVEGQPADARTDLWALGAILYEMVAGQRAFAGTSTATLIAAIMSAEPPALATRQPLTPPSVERLVRRCLAKAPDDRPDTAHDVASELRSLRETSGVPAVTAAQPRRRRGLRTALVIAGGLALIMAGAGVAWRLRPPAPRELAHPSPDVRPAEELNADGVAGPAAVTTLDPEKVVVAVFVNRTGDPSLDPLGLQISDWVTQSLTRIGVKVAINPELPSLGSPGLPRSVLGAAPDPVRALAERAGAGLVVSGAYYLDGDALRVQSQVNDGASSDITSTFDPSVGPRSKPSDVVAGVARVVTGAMALRLNKTFVAVLGSAYTPPSYGAYVEWVQATAHLGADPREAERHYRRSLQVDPDFLAARYGLCLALIDQGRLADADAELRILEEPATYSQATPWEQAVIRAKRAYLDGDLGGELQAYTEAARLSPTPLTLWAVAAVEGAMHHPRAALEGLSRIRVADSPAEFGPLASFFLANRALFHHEVGEYEKQLETARLGQQHYPADGAFFSHEVGAMVALGRVTELDAVMARAERSTLQSGSVGDVLYHSARELSAHGHADAARAMASRAATWCQNHLEAREPTPQLRRTYALVLLLAGECHQALAVGRDLVRQEPDSLDALGTHATVLASCGSRAEAQTIADDLARRQSTIPARRASLSAREGPRGAR